MTDAVRIHDLADPELPEWFLELHDTMGIGPDQPPRPRRAARRGDRGARASTTSATRGSSSRSRRSSRRSRPTASSARWAGSRPVSSSVGLLTTRLRLARLLARHPEILDIPVEAPVVVLGLPRTGTSHLLDLLSADPRFRYLPYWESLEPIAPGDGRPPVDGPDPRVERTDLALTMINTAMPLFPAMHEMSDPRRPRGNPAPRGRLLHDALRGELRRRRATPAGTAQSDQTHAYRTMKVLLQVLQFLRPAGTRWLLKSPQHLEQLGPLLTVFPDARDRADPPRPGGGDRLDGDHGRLLPAHQLPARRSASRSARRGRSGSRRCCSPRCGTGTSCPPTR